MPKEYSRKAFLRGSLGVAVGVSLASSLPSFSLAAERSIASKLSSLAIFKEGYPHAFFFQSQTTNDPRNGSSTYEEWEKKALPLDGLMAKVLSEERVYTGSFDNLGFINQYKARHPEKLALLYFNGRGRVASDEATRDFYDGHWLYYAGTNLTRALAASRSANTLQVSKTSCFSMARYLGDSPDDVALVAVDSNGRPDWRRVEHVRLRSIRNSRKEIVVERGAYGSRTLSFSSGAYLAAHVMSRASTEEKIPFWTYNFSTVCPKDLNGKTGAFALADYLVAQLREGGRLAAFDGITLDAFDFVAEGRPAEEIDANGDGNPDGGMFSNVNQFGIGTVNFSSYLRRKLPNKLVIADCTDPSRLQRSFSYINGVESEGFPDLFDHDFAATSKGINTFSYWNQSAILPRLNYINFKYRQKTPPGNRNTFTEQGLTKDDSYRKLRLALASAVFTNSALTFPPEWAPPESLWRREGVMVKVFDELWRGEDQVPNWLGQPKGEAQFVATKAPDLLQGKGRSWPPDFVKRFKRNGISLARTRNGSGYSMTIKATRYDTEVTALEREMYFSLPGIALAGTDLFVTLQIIATPSSGYPSTIARRIYVKAANDKGTSKESFTWAGSRPFTARFAYSGIGPGKVTLSFRAEGSAPLRILKMTIHSSSDGVYRDFDNGVVFANFSNKNFTFALANLLPGVQLKRFRASESQDRATNSGRTITNTLTLKPQNALFAVKQQS